MLLPGGAPRALDYCIGADLSSLKQQEDGGSKFRDSTGVKPGLQMFRQHGYGWIRLRIFYAPTALPNNQTYTIALAQQAKVAGFKILLDFHYSDNWADPGKQVPPAKWSGLSHAQLVDSVFQYTRNTIAAFRNAGVLPEMVQIGNEITPGMLLPDGSTSNWTKLGDLLKAGVRGVDSGRAASAMPLIMLHIDRGGDQATTKTWFDNANAQGVPYDVIGQSYYPQWQGTLANLRTNFTFMGNTYNKDVIAVEIGLNAYTNSSSGPVPLTNAGQVAFLDSVDSIVRATPNNHGKGLMWWEPTNNSLSPNTRCYFDASLIAKPVMYAFDKYATPILTFRENGRLSMRSGIFNPAVVNGLPVYGINGRALQKIGREKFIVFPASNQR